ncbi:MAG: SPFH domain-containing protein [Candidatus Micrarchaeia archaeon]
MDRQSTIFLVILFLIVAVFAGIASGMVPLWLVILLGGLALVLAVLRPELVEVKEYERIVVLRFGKLQGVEGPGWFWHFPTFEKFMRVDLRVQAVDIEPQKVISRDNIEFIIDAVIYLKVTDPLKAVTAVQDYKQAATLNVHSQIRNAVGKLSLEEVIVQTDHINTQLHQALAESTKDWGVQCVKVEIQSIEPPKALVEAMRRRKEAQEYKAKLEIEAQAREIQIDILNRAASKISDTTLAYLYLDSLKKISEGKSNKIIFPLELSRLASLLSTKLVGGGETHPSEANVREMVRQAVEKQAIAGPAKAPSGAQQGPQAQKQEAPAMDYDKIVSELLDAYRKKQSQILGGESEKEPEEPKD